MIYCCVAEQDLLELGGLALLERVLDQMATGRTRGLYLVIPNDVWSSSASHDLSVLLQRHSGRYRTIGGDRVCDVCVRPPVLDTLSVSVLARTLADRTILCVGVVASAGNDLRPYVVFVDDEPRQLGCRVSATAFGDHIGRALDLSARFESCRGTRLIVVGGGAQRAAELIRGQLPFLEVRPLDVPEKKSPSATWRKRINQLVGGGNSIVVATSRVGHAYTEGIACTVCPGHSATAVLRHVVKQALNLDDWPPGNP